MPKKSQNIFQNSDGLPMQFHLPRCRNDSYRQQIVSLIQNNGGEVKNSARENVILLVDPEKIPSSYNTHFSRAFYSAQFVVDSVENGQLLEIRDYQAGGPEVEEAEQEEEDDNNLEWQSTSKLQANSKARESAKRNSRGRNVYTTNEDRAIIAYIDEHPEKSPKGKTIFIDMEKKGIVKHPWQSIQNHYKKVLLPSLENNRGITPAKTQTTPMKGTPKGDSSGAQKSTTPTAVPVIKAPTPKVPTPKAPAPKVPTPKVTEPADEESESEEEVVVEKSGKRKREEEAPSQDSNKSKTKSKTDEIVDKLCLEFEVHKNVVYHALITHSGIIEAAKEYLRSGGEPNEKTWTYAEDLVLIEGKDTNKLDQLRKKKGKEACLKRLDWVSGLLD